MHSQESGPISQGGGGQNPTSLAFFPGVCSGGYLSSSGGPTPTTPRQFLPCQLHIIRYAAIRKYLPVKCRRNIVKIKYWFRFLPRDAKQARPFAVIQCLSVCLSVTFVDSVKTNKRIFKNFHHRIAKPF